jgi:hypothetical protein
MSLVETGAELARWLVLSALLFAAGAKTAGFAAFRQSIVDGVPMLSAQAGAWAMLVIAAEWGIGLAMLLGGGALRPASLAAALLFAGFTAVIVIALARGDALVCSCFGAGGRQVGFADVVRGVLFASAAAWACSAAPSAGWTLPERLLLGGLGIALVLPTVWMRESLWLLRAKAGE